MPSAGRSGSSWRCSFAGILPSRARVPVAIAALLDSAEAELSLLQLSALGIADGEDVGSLHVVE